MRFFLFTVFSLYIIHSFAQKERLENLLRIPDTKAKTDSLHQCALYYESTNIDSCRIVSTLTLQCAQKINYPKGEAAAFIVLGICEWEMGNLQKASDYYLKSLRICEKIKNTDGAIACMNNLGALYSEHGNYTTALEYLYNAKKLAIKTNNKKRIPSLYNTIGSIYSKRDMIDSAKINYDRALAIYEAEDYLRGKAEIYNNYAVLFSKQKNIKKAIEYHLKDLDICRQLRDNYGLALGLNNLSWMTFENGNIKQAMIYSDEALKICLEQNYTDNLKFIYMNRHNIYAAAGEYKKAYQALEKFTNLKDSLQGIESKKIIEELSVRYQTEKKQYHIDSLSRENKIKDLESTKKDADLERSHNTRNIIIAGALVLMIGVFVWIVFYRNRQKRKQLELEKLNLQIEQTLLRAQMNPHFIFNALNSIQGFIAEQQGLSAQRFLAKFAQLMRYVLEYNSKDYVALEDDMHVLQIYMELEQLRFNHTFDFTIEENNTDTGSWQVPPMVAQPFIENAILHGLQHLPGKGKLNINLHEKGDVLTIEIMDNGVGRKKSAWLRKATEGKKKSMGMQMAKQRLDLLNTKRTHKITYHVHNLKETENTGTVVRINIPYESLN